MYSSVVEGGGASGLWLEGRVRSMLTVMLGGDLDFATRVQAWILTPRHIDVKARVRVRVRVRATVWGRLVARAAGRFGSADPDAPEAMHEGYLIPR